MTDIILFTIISLSGIGLISAIILYFVAQRFKVFEDPRIDLVQEVLPGANCGGCGYAGCRNFAEALVKADELSGLFCPVGGNDTMSGVATILGKQATAQAPLVAVVRCNGTPAFRQRKTIYDGTPSCAIAHLLYTGEGDCPHGCLGCGDCVVVCKFDAIYMDPESGLPIIDDAKCTACNACVKACPRHIIELRTKQKHDRKIYISCINEEKGAIAIKGCKVACIGCGKCVKVCAFDAITMDHNLAFIDSAKCKLCRKCAPECPTNSILEINFQERKVKVETVAPDAAQV
jgi:Na+-translocating ferredoxin:NAD+ oxidoreductase subunit B